MGPGGGYSTDAPGAPDRPADGHFAVCPLASSVDLGLPLWQLLLFLYAYSQLREPCALSIQVRNGDGEKVEAYC